MQPWAKGGDQTGTASYPRCHARFVAFNVTQILLSFTHNYSDSEGALFSAHQIHQIQSEGSV